MDQKDVYLLSKEYLSKDIEDFTWEDVEVFQDIITHHSKLYYEKEAPIISDNDYDVLFQKLKKLEGQFWSPEKITNTVGSEFRRSTFEKVDHNRPMISLDNTYNAEDLEDFDTRIQKKIQSNITLEYMLEFKFDGLWVELVYRQWKFVQAITRWNGLQGEDVTENVRQITNIPHEISYVQDIEVRGEVLMPLSSFEKLNTQAKLSGEKVFANPRNAASGSLRILDTSITSKRDLKFFAYDISDFETYGRTTYSDMIESLESLWFEISNYFHKCSSIQEVIEQIQDFWDIKKQIDFEIDGLVIKVNDIALWKEIGYTEHHPRYAISYKFPAEIQTTTIESVQHSVGRTWTITPVANVSPVVLSGATIRRSTLHNYDEVEKLDIREGDKVFIKRAGEVIPKIVSVVKEVRDGSEKPIKIPSECPSCGETVYKDQSKVRYYCANTLSCPAQNKEQLAYSVWKGGFDIDGFWEKQVEIFLREGLITSLVDIFYLRDKRDQILELEWFQEKSVNNLIAGIERVKQTGIVTFLRSIGIPGVGKKTAKTLSQVFVSTDDIRDFSLTQEDLVELWDVGPEIAKNVVEFFTEKKDFLAQLLEVLDISFPKPTNQNNNWKYAGKKMCITGSFDGYTRDQLVEMLEKEWGEFVGSVSKKTDYLLAGEKAGGKLKKASELGVEVLEIKDFLS